MSNRSIIFTTTLYTNTLADHRLFCVCAHAWVKRANIHQLPNIICTHTKTHMHIHMYTNTGFACIHYTWLNNQRVAPKIGGGALGWLACHLLAASQSGVAVDTRSLSTACVLGSYAAPVLAAPHCTFTDAQCFWSCVGNSHRITVFTSDAVILTAGRERNAYIIVAKRKTKKTQWCTIWIWIRSWCVLRSSTFARAVEKNGYCASVSATNADADRPCADRRPYFLYARGLVPRNRPLARNIQLN